MSYLTIKKALSIGMGLLLFIQPAFASVAESSIWEERRSRLDNQAVASLPKSSPHGHFNPNDFLKQMPSLKKSLSAQNDLIKVTSSQFSKVSPELKNIINSIPLSHSRIQDVFDSGNDDKSPVVIIQDVHLNPEAQTNIAAVIQELINQKQVNVVGVEGAFEKLDFTPFRELPDKKIIKKVADAFLKNKFLAAPSYVGITSQNNIPTFLGVDDRQHHKANVDAYLKTRPLKETTRLEISKIEHHIENAKFQFFSSELKSFDNLRTSFTKGNINIGPYVQKLAEYEVSLDLDIDQFLMAYELERRLDFKKVERERKRIIEQLARTLNKKSLSDLVAQSLAYRMGQISFGSYYQKIRDLCLKNKINLRGTPAFDDYIRYVLLSEGIKAERLFTSIGKLEKTILDNLARTETEVKIAELSNQINLITKLIDFELTPNEWSQYLKGNRNLVSIQKNVFDLIKLESDNISITTDLSEYEKFYHEAEIRSQIMVDKLTRKDLIGNKVLVTGGFHTPEIAQLLREKETSYIVITPKITTIETEDGTSYLSFFSSERTPIEQLFTGAKLFVSPTTVQANHPRVGIPMLAAVTSLVNKLNVVQIIWNKIPFIIYVPSNITSLKGYKGSRAETKKNITTGEKEFWASLRMVKFFKDHFKNNHYERTTWNYFGIGLAIFIIWSAMLISAVSIIGGPMIVLNYVSPSSSKINVSAFLLLTSFYILPRVVRWVNIEIHNLIIPVFDRFDLPKPTLPESDDNKGSDQLELLLGEVEVGVSWEDLSPSTLSKDEILSVLNSSPSELIGVLKKDRLLKILFTRLTSAESPDRVLEKRMVYTLEERAIQILEEFDRHFGDDLFEHTSLQDSQIDRGFFRLLLVFHEIGKLLSLAYEGDKSEHIKYRGQALSYFLGVKNWNFSEDQINFALALLSGEPFARIFTGSVLMHPAPNLIIISKMISKAAKRSGLPIDIFTSLSSAAFKAVAGSVPKYQEFFVKDDPEYQNPFQGFSNSYVPFLENLAKELVIVDEQLQQNPDSANERLKFLLGDMAFTMREKNIGNVRTPEQLGRNREEDREKIHRLWSSGWLSSRTRQEDFQGHEEDLVRAINRLRSGNLIADYYFGSNANTLRGLSNTNFLVLSATLLRELGIPVLSGEQERRGAGGNKIFVAVTNSFTTAQGYSNKDFNGPITKSPEEIELEISNLLKQNRKFATLEKRGAIMVLQELLSTIRNNTELVEDYNKHAWPMVLGISRDIEARLARIPGYRSDVDGEINVLFGIDLSEITHVYVRSQNIEDTQHLLDELREKVRSQIRLHELLVKRVPAENPIHSELKRLKSMLTSVEQIEIVAFDEIEFFIPKRSAHPNRTFPYLLNQREQHPQEWDKNAILFLESALQSLKGQNSNSDHPDDPSLTLRQTRINAVRFLIEHGLKVTELRIRLYAAIVELPKTFRPIKFFNDHFLDGNISKSKKNMILIGTGIFFIVGVSILTPGLIYFLLSDLSPPARVIWSLISLPLANISSHALLNTLFLFFSVGPRLSTSDVNILNTLQEKLTKWTSQQQNIADSDTQFQQVDRLKFDRINTNDLPIGTEVIDNKSIKNKPTITALNQKAFASKIGEDEWVVQALPGEFVIQQGKGKITSPGHVNCSCVSLRGIKINSQTNQIEETLKAHAHVHPDGGVSIKRKDYDNSFGQISRVLEYLGQQKQYTHVQFVLSLDEDKFEGLGENLDEIENSIIEEGVKYGLSVQIVKSTTRSKNGEGLLEGDVIVTEEGVAIRHKNFDRSKIDYLKFIQWPKIGQDSFLKRQELIAALFPDVIQLGIGSKTLDPRSYGYQTLIKRIERGEPLEEILPLVSLLRESDENDVIDYPDSFRQNTTTLSPNIGVVRIMSPTGDPSLELRSLADNVGSNGFAALVVFEGQLNEAEMVLAKQLGIQVVFNDGLLELSISELNNLFGSKFSRLKIIIDEKAKDQLGNNLLESIEQLEGNEEKIPVDVYLTLGELIDRLIAIRISVSKLMRMKFMKQALIAIQA